jgi:B-cell CLL/lymphoma 9 protein
MQQQSHIFVFSTVLANKGAEAVRNGQFLTIIAFHCAQAETKKFLQKFPLKNNQFNRPGWFSNLNKNQQQQQQQQQGNNKRMMNTNQQNFNLMKNNSMNPQQSGNMMNPMGMQGNFQQQNMNNTDGGMLWGSGNPQQMNSIGSNNAIDPLFGDSLDSLVNDSLDPTVGCLDPSNPNQIPSLQGVKVPDEDLTPQQRQNRALKLAQLQELKQMFKQEPPGDIPMTDQEMQAACNKQINVHGPMNQMHVSPMQMGPGPMNPGVNNPIRPMGPRPMGPQNPLNDNMMGGMHNMGNVPMGQGMMGIGNNGGGINNNPNSMHPMQGGNNMNMPPMNMMQGGNMGPQQMMQQQKVMPSNVGVNPDWNKMQNEFEGGKRKGGPGGPMCGPMDMNDPLGPNPNFMNRQMPPNAMRNMGNIRGQGPPPPYHQTSRSNSVSMATQSPNSPINPTSNLSLPSPRAGVNSALNSPAPCDPQRHMGMKSLNTRQSPTNNSSQGSPASTLNRQINHSSPSTPVSSHLSPSASINKDIESQLNPNIPSKLTFLY